MKWIFLFSLLLPFQNFIFSQETNYKKKKTYKMIIYDQQSKNSQGYLQNIGDSTVSIIQPRTLFGGTGKKEQVYYTDISSITLKRKGNVGKGAILGAVGGFLIGAIIGISAGDDPIVIASQPDFLRFKAEEKAIAGGFLLSSLGLAVGGLIGELTKKKFMINGRKENFEAMRLHTLEYIYAPAKH